MNNAAMPGFVKEKNVLISWFYTGLSLLTCSPGIAEPLPYKQLQLNPGLQWQFSSSAKPIVIAVIDDGFRYSHNVFKGMLWENPGELNGNQLDDDNNGYIDDLVGWDVSDMDNAVTPPASRSAEFYHGTHTAGIIAQIIRYKLGERNSYPVKLMLVKAIPDSAQRFYVKDGYKGVQYALDNGADIISNSWSGGKLTGDNANTLHQAQNDGIFVVNSVGNFHSLEPSFPAEHPAVFGVAGVDANNKVVELSNYGEMVDLSAPGAVIYSAGVSSDNDWQPQSGTSVATPMVAATAALMLLKNRNLSPGELSACLKNTASSIESNNQNIAGQLGAGSLNIDGAIDCAAAVYDRHRNDDIYVPEGTLFYHHTNENTTKRWNITPAGEYEAIRLDSYYTGDADGSRLTIYQLESGGQVLSFWSGEVKDLPSYLSIPGGRVRIELAPGSDQKEFNWHSRFAVKPMQFSKRYCKNRIEIMEDTTILDGSAVNPYAAESDCQWLVVPGEDQAIQIKFTKLDLELNHDVIHMFRGDSTRQQDLLMTITGKKLPPTIVVKGNSALLWFLSDKQEQKDGFRFEVKLIADKPMN